MAGTEKDSKASDWLSGHPEKQAAPGLKAQSSCGHLWNTDKRIYPEDPGMGKAENHVTEDSLEQIQGWRVCCEVIRI